MEQKTKHAQQMEIVNQVASLAAQLGIVHNETEDISLDGKHVRIRGQDLLFFGSCGYLGLEYDQRLSDGAIDAIRKYGTQFSSSRAYVSSRYYKEAEDLMYDMFGKPTVLVQSLTLGHLTNIPVLVDDNDAVILDSQAHDSIQNAVYGLRMRNIKVELVRHNRMDILEERIRELSKHYRKVWYMCDGVYSMQGDFAPVKELYTMMDQYEQFNLYIDDIHGMSWAGPNGTGYVLSQIDFHERLHLTTGLTKAFGVAGGCLVFPEKSAYQLVRNVGKSFIFSIQMPPMVLGAVIESAKIHLSDEIYTIQNELRKKVDYFNAKTKQLGLPLINESYSPIGFIGVGKPDTGYNMVNRLMKNGYYVNLSVFPSVSYNNTGLRIPINNKLSIADIDGLLHCIEKNLPLALEESSATMTDVYRSFKLVA
ncbi:MAG: aminotransferase class I/II-fold pyridoxal phosphate-dependent enzyme [Bacteroidota bacterium]